MKFIPRLFVDNDLIENSEIKLSDNQFHYLINVLRKTIGDIVVLVNGRNGEFESKVTDVNKKYCSLLIAKQTRKFIAQPFLGLIFSPIKNFDIVAKMSTELGVTEFLPIITEYGNRNNFRKEKFVANVTEAVEQSERLDLPKVYDLDSLDKILAKIDENSAVLFCEERTAENSIIDVLKSIDFKNNIYVLVGAEGGFSEKEKEMVKKYKQVVSVSLGDLILRSETAAASVLSIVSNHKRTI